MKTTKNKKPAQKTKPRPLGTAVIVSDRCHYYEKRGSVEVYISREGQPFVFGARVPWSKLLESLRRCRPEVLA